jgi:hypothetical protein
MALSMQPTQERSQAAGLLLAVICKFTCGKNQPEAASAAWKQWVAEQLDEELAGNLFLAAAARGNAKAVEALDAIQPAAVADAMFGNALADAVEQKQAVLLKALCTHSSMSAATPSMVQLMVSLLLAALENGF